MITVLKDLLENMKAILWQPKELVKPIMLIVALRQLHIVHTQNHISIPTLKIMVNIRNGTLKINVQCQSTFSRSWGVVLGLNFSKMASNTEKGYSAVGTDLLL